MFLCIDTATSEAGIALADANVFFRESIDAYNASESIIEHIDSIVKKAGIELSELKGVFVIKGPGSFTGLRVGISVANQFAHQLNIPIIGLRTDEWWGYRTDGDDVLYLQSMNKAEVYIGIVGRHCDVSTKPTILPIEELSKFGGKKWIGEIKEEHRQKLPDGFTEITDLKTPEETWKEIVKSYEPEVMNLKPYDLIEPYYGKDVNITKSKKKLSI